MADPEVNAAPTAPALTMLVASAVIVVAAWVVLVLWGLGTAPMHTTGEPREALVVWEMTHGGGWILPRRNGVELPSKPPLFHWLGALTSLARGTTDAWSIRFPSAALSLLGVLGVLAAGAYLWSVRAGLIGALALLTMFEWARASVNARVDMAHTFGLELGFLSLLFFLRTRAALWLPALCIGISLAVLGKGPIGVVLPGLTALGMFVVLRDFSYVRHMHLLRGTLAVILIAGSWYAVAWYLGGWEFFYKHVLLENVFSLIGPADVDYVGHRHSPLYLLGTLLLGALPWTVFFPGVVARLWLQRRQIERTDARIYLLVWIGVVFGVYALAASKRSVYLLALYPALALLLGWWWAEQMQEPRSAAWVLRPLRYVSAVLIAGMLLLTAVTVLELMGAGVGARVQSWVAPAAEPYGAAIGDLLRSGGWLMLCCTLTASVALYAGARAARSNGWVTVFGSVFVTMVAVTVATRQIVLPGIAERASVRDLMANVRNVVGVPHDLSFFNTFSYGAVYYWGGHIPVYTGSWPEGAPRYLLMSADEWQAAPSAARTLYERVPLPNASNLGEARRLVLVRRVRVD